MSEQDAKRPELKRLREIVQQGLSDTFLKMALVGIADPRLDVEDGLQVMIDCAVEQIAKSILDRQQPAEQDWPAAEIIRVQLLARLGELREKQKANAAFAADLMSALAEVRERHR
ncbi:MAG TPA: hypothetical protein VF503_01220 [Sphingobium sp.]|uniref:hypothetical protein n=1 Tax=Sphingobium sp. TaxID=1912891 RepID=UPI002ED34920